MHFPMISNLIGRNNGGIFVNMKKMLAAMVAGTMLLTTAPILPGSMMATVYAAKGGAKFSAPKAAPKPAAPSAKQDAPKAASPNSKDYAPSKNAKDLDKNAPAANSKAAAGTTAAANSGTSRIGNMMRNIGLLAGGMMLGGLLASMLGMEGMSEIMGILANVALALVAFMAIRWIWGRIRGGSSNKEEEYRRGYEAAMRQQGSAIDVTPRQESKIVDIKPMAGDYDAKRTADRYRSR